MLSPPNRNVSQRGHFGERLFFIIDIKTTAVGGGQE